MNLGGIYKDLGNLDQALASTLKSLELKPDNPGAVNNLKAFIEQLNLSASNAKNLTRAYELLLNQTDISHRKAIENIFTGISPNNPESIGIRSDYLGRQSGFKGISCRLEISQIPDLNDPSQLRS